MIILRPSQILIILFLTYSLPSHAIISLFDSERSQQAKIQHESPQNSQNIITSQVSGQSIVLPIQRLTGINYFSNRYRIIVLADDNESYAGTFSKNAGGELLINEQVFNIVSVAGKKVTLKSKASLQCMHNDYIRCLDDKTFELSMLSVATKEEEKLKPLNTAVKANKVTPDSQSKETKKVETLDAVARKNIANFKRDREALAALQKKAQSKVIRDPELVKNPPPGYVLHKSPFGDYLLPEK